MVKPKTAACEGSGRRIRLTGLLRKTPAHVGVFYRSFAGRLVLVAATAGRGAISLEPLGAGARPFASPAVPASRHTAPRRYQPRPMASRRFRAALGAAAAR